MERGLGSASNDRPGSIDKSRVLDVKPLRCLMPVFPNSPGMSSASTPQPTPFTCIPPAGPFPPGVQPFYPFLVQNGTQQTAPGAQDEPSNFGSGSRIPAPVPLNSFRTPTPQANGGSGQRKRASARSSGPVRMEDDGYNDSQNQSDQYGGDFSTQGTDEVVSNSGKRRGRPKKTRRENGQEFDVESLVNSFLTSFKLKEFDDFRRSNGDRDIVGTILLVFDLIRRRLTQLEEAKDLAPGFSKRPDLKAGTLLMTKGVRTNSLKRAGHVPGIEVGDIFFFRMELCLVGLHAPSMAGIDYMTVKVTMDEEPMAVSIVSSGGYDDEGDDGDVLIYSGSGGLQRKDGQMSDQKLERGNLALEKSLHRANDVRVIRGLKDASGSTGKIYVYDGVYKIQESWAEKKSGCNVFKYKLVRVPGQPEAFTLWKSIQQWKDGTATRTGIILPDLTSGAESQPVALVNDVDGEKGPAHFTYIRGLNYTKPFSISKPFSGCHCLGGCQPGTNCPCNQKNDGLLPYSSLGVLLTNKYLIHECGQTCACPPNCRNRMSQAGLKVRLEVFKTNNRGWGLRSWDPIRAGGFICEYAGDVITADDLANDNDDNYIFNATRYYEPLEAIHDDSTRSEKAPFPLVISAKHSGNVARFMNHSCSPNVFWLPVLRESNNDSYLHIAFFAIRHIPPMQELTYDYGMVPPEKGQEGKKKCLCGSVKCKGYFY
ncbi:histone H3 (Lys9) methyltransferase SUV39H1/Clr4, required for transcriptional silencing [Handroanthus impetiginosus]|uniref:Histone H3 (Lys9) methyltransferase SUV39H1/Clr4, required for transcriptional silencing n=1 Tax=Handroanthus impetiginosus TaxID=429701 RepID=A0A2G9HMV9_9LAMI|nr:histone H3 (Lys9) methyltransferase SUV39H1/Clr4, required for transcriptional silencing [Handroanthus impetiginosus]